MQVLAVSGAETGLRSQIYFYSSLELKENFREKWKTDNELALIKIH